MFDLREHLEALEEKGELLVIDEEISENLKAPAMAAMSNRAGAQAIQFKKIHAYPKAYSLAANLLSGPGHHYFYKRKMWARVAMGLEIDPGINYEELISTLIDRYHHPIMPVKIKSGPCKEEIRMGNEVNLLEFPFPILHKEDGGRYGFGVLIVKDLDTDWQNWGVYRFMVVDQTKAVSDFLTEPSLSKDTRKIYEKYATINKPMPFAIAIGGPPAIILAGAMRLPSGISEAEYAGGLNLDPINLVNAETSDILVPADAEIVIEGEISLKERVEEGPYGSIKGYTKVVPRPLMKIKAITHRKDPILPFVVDGTKVCDTQVIISVTESARLTRMGLEEEQLPLRWLQIPPEWNLGICVTSIINAVHGMVARTARYLFNITNLFDKIVVVDSDIYSTQLTSVLVDWSNKTHPIRGHHVMEGFPPAVMPNYKELELGKGMPRYYVDACWPAWWKKEERPTPISFETSFSEELQQRVIKRWKEEFKIPIEPRIFPGKQR